MKKVLLSFVLLIAGVSNMQAQTTKTFFTDVGVSNGTFQDLKYSAVSYSGPGVVLNFGWNQDNPEYVWEAGLRFNLGTESAGTHDAGRVTVLHPTIYGRYLKKLNDKLAVGAHWDILELNLRSTAGLGNNSIYYLSGSNLFATADYKKGKWSFGLDMGLLSFFKEGTGFAFSAAQSDLEDGNFNYQDKNLGTPLGFSSYSLGFLSNHLNLRTKIGYRMSDRFSFAYRWGVRHFTQVEDRAVTIGNHQLIMRYNFMYSTKTKES